MNGPLDVEATIAALSTETGLTDLGDPTYRDGLDAFLDAVAADAVLNPVGDGVLAAQVTGALRVRLMVEQWWADHPHLDEERIERPVFIVGMSRSGTTALSHLLACDPANRSLLGWEASSPVPPATPETYATDPRFEAAKATGLGVLHQLNPSIAAAHHDPPDMPVECLITMAQHFVSLSLPTMFPIPSYADWVLTADHGPVYQWHSRVLRVLQSGGVRGRWVLKSPHHAIALEALIERYPDARFIVTHRDPATCVASAAGLGREFARTFAEPPSGAELGQQWTTLLGAMADGIIAHRARHGDDRFIDVPYRRLTDDPIGTVTQIYDQLGEQVSSAFESALRAHVGVAVQNRFGRHSYDLDEFDLDRQALDERFAGYHDRFADELWCGSA